MKKFLALLLALLLVFSLVACGQEATEESEETQKATETTAKATEKETKETTTQEGDTTVESETAGTSEEVDLSDFSLGVSEDGDNVLVTVQSETEVGTVTCVMTFWYENDKLTKETADYYVPDADTAGVLAEELNGDSTIESGSVTISGNCVSCKLKDSELTELQELTHDELAEAMSYAIGTIQ